MVHKKQEVRRQHCSPEQLVNLVIIWTTMLRAKSNWNWFNGSVEDFQWGKRILTISLNDPFQEEYGPFIEKTWIPSIRLCIEPSLIEIEESWIPFLKIFRQFHGQMDDKQSEKLTWAFSSGSLKDKQLHVPVVTRTFIFNGTTHPSKIFWGPT